MGRRWNWSRRTLSPRRLVVAWPTSLWAFVGAALVFLAAAAGVWATSGQGSDFPSWLAAFATLAALMAAIFAGRYAARAFNLESQRERRWEDTQRKQQASLVAAWYGQKRSPSAQVADDAQASPSERYRPALYVRNASGLPVTEVFVTVSVGRHILVKLMLPEATEGTPLPIGVRGVMVLPPAAEPVCLDFTTDMAETFDEVFSRSRKPNTTEILVDLSFTDAAGIRWRRPPRGAIYEVGSEG